MTAPGSESTPVTQVTEGMHVIDRDGTDVGKVKLIQMGDPQAVTIEGQEPPPSGPVAALADTLAGPEPDLPPPLAARLLRTGFLKVDCSGFLTGDAYVPATDVADVVDGTVHLSITRDELVK